VIYPECPVTLIEINPVTYAIDRCAAPSSISPTRVTTE
jgi:hypothetical protein